MVGTWVMLFNDDFVFGQSALGDSGWLGGFGRTGFQDASEVVIVGRVPGSLYVDSLPGAMTALEWILPYAQSTPELLAQAPDVELEVNTVSGDAVEVAEAPAPVEPAADEPAAAMVAQVVGKIDQPLVLPTMDDGVPLAGFDGLDLTDFGRPTIDLSPIAPVITVTAPDMTGGEQPAPVIPGGRAYQSLAFLLIDTPFVVDDEHLPPTVRPPLNQLLGLPDEDEAEVGQTWILPSTGRGAWILR